MWLLDLRVINENTGVVTSCIIDYRSTVLNIKDSELSELWNKIRHTTVDYTEYETGLVIHEYRLKDEETLKVFSDFKELMRERGKDLTNRYVYSISLRNVVNTLSINLARCRYHYYVTSEPIVPDSYFDRIEKCLKTLVNIYPWLDNCLVECSHMGSSVESSYPMSCRENKLLSMDFGNILSVKHKELLDLL